MEKQVDQPQIQGSDDKKAITSLYYELLACWNRRSTQEYAALITDNGNLIGFDGSVMNGRSEVEEELRKIFHDHQTAHYYGKIREVRLLAPVVGILRAVAGMVSPGQTDINPAVNSIQTLVALKTSGQWKITLFQNTPAQFHGRPDLSDALTAELRQLLKKTQV